MQAMVKQASMSSSGGSATRYTFEEWNAEGARRFGADQMKWRFVCPACGHVAAVQDWKDAGAPVEAAAFSAEDIAVLQTMADQLATAIDNAEMFERAQARADRERRVRDITERIHRSPDAGILMRVAVEELSQMLGASKAVIRLGTRERLIAESGGPSYAEE